MCSELCHSIEFDTYSLLSSLLHFSFPPSHTPTPTSANLIVSYIRSLIRWMAVVFRLCLLRTTPQHKCKLLLYYYYRQYSVFHLCIIYDDDIQAQPIKYCQNLATMITTTTTKFVIESHPRAHRTQWKNVKLKANVVRTSRNRTIRCVRAVSHRMRAEE